MTKQGYGSVSWLINDVNKSIKNNQRLKFALFFFDFSGKYAILKKNAFFYLAIFLRVHYRPTKL